MIGHGDFLDRLALRQVTPSIGVRPRLPSRFAHAGPLGLVEEDAVQPAPRASIPESSTVGEPRSVPIARADGPSRTIRSITRPVPAVEAGTHEAHAPEPGRAAVVSAARPAPAAPEPSRERNAERVVGPAEPPLPVKAVAVATPPDVEPSPPERLVPLTEETQTAGRGRSDLLVDIRREVLAVPVVPERTTPTAGRRNEGPRDVTVSIGRIEVRAITDSVPAAPPPLPGAERRPTLSLDEYLERRHGAAVRR
jgi:hypothetical protein